MQSPVTASPRCITIALTLCLLLAVPVFLMMLVDVNATPFPQHVAHAHVPHPVSASTKAGASHP